MELLLVLIGAAAGLGGSIIVETHRSRRDHARWQLERRYDAYVTALAHVDRLLTWASQQASAPNDSVAPDGHDFHEFAASLALVGSGEVQAAWARLDTTFAQFPLAHAVAAAALRAAHTEGKADSDDAMRLRIRLGDVVSSARECQVELAQVMQRDLSKLKLFRGGGRNAITRIDLP